MGTACSEPEIPLDKNYNPYANMNLPINKSKKSHTMSLSDQITSAIGNKKFSSNGPIQKISSLDIGVSPIQPFVKAPIIEIPELETSVIRTENYMDTINTAMQQQEAARAAMMQQQAMAQQQMRMQMQQQRQMAIQKQKQALMAQHGPPPNTAVPAELPPVTPAINERRKQLKMLKYQGQAKGVMLGPLKFTNNGTIYFGQWNNGHPHGKGLIYFADGSVFQGGFFQGNPMGKGRLISTNGDYYQGTVSNNSAAGVGVSENSIVRYQGQFENNIPHGQGVQTSLDGQSKFVGTFNRGNKVAGIFVWGQKGEYRYQGQFEQSVFSGHGSLKSPGGLYIGQFSNGQKNGKGKYQWLDGRMYQGSYQNDMKSGYGQLYNADGSISYKGQWRNDFPNGKGTTVVNGVQTTGSWIDGHFSN